MGTKVRIADCIKGDCILTAEQRVSPLELLNVQGAKEYEEHLKREACLSIGAELHRTGRFTMTRVEDSFAYTRVYRAEAFVMTREEVQKALDTAFLMGRADANIQANLVQQATKRKAKETAIESFVAGFEIGLKSR